jgi:hypothetical protein
MRIALDITGETYGLLTVLRLTRNLPRRAWRCQCVCGRKKTILQMDLRSGNTRSCGCLFHKGNNSSHGEARPEFRTKEYTAWADLKARCTNPKNSSFKNYGGRGITVCKRWLNSYENFLKDMGRAPSPEYSIDRVNNNGNYTPNNCRWATAKTQANNKRRAA